MCSGGEHEGRRLRLVEERPRVLVAAGNGERRAELLDDLTRTMPENTLFLEAETMAEAMELAPRCRLVVVGGPLGEVPGEALVKLLARRHPQLTVVNMAVTGSE